MNYEDYEKGAVRTSGSADASDGSGGDVDISDVTVLLNYLAAN